MAATILFLNMNNSRCSHCRDYHNDKSDWLKKNEPGISLFTNTFEIYKKCNCCSNELVSKHIHNPVFGTNCRIKDIKNKPIDKVFGEIMELDEIKNIQPSLNTTHTVLREKNELTPILTRDNYTLVKYIYNYICNPQNKNNEGFNVYYCKTCDKVYDISHKIVYKWCFIPYYSKTEQVAFTDDDMMEYQNQNHLN